MKIAITGAKGNVGSAVVKYCASKGYKTVQIDMTEFEKLEGCVTCLSVRVR